MQKSGVDDCYRRVVWMIAIEEWYSALTGIVMKLLLRNNYHLSDEYEE